MSTLLGFRLRMLQLAIVAIAIGLAGCQTNEFKSKYKQIQMDMTEDQVDRLLDASPELREDFAAVQTDLGPPDGPCIRSPLFRKWYTEKTDAIEGDYCIVVYFDENYMVVHKELSEVIK